MDVVYKVRNDLAILNDDRERIDYLNRLINEAQNLATIIVCRNNFEFAEITTEENKDVPVCNED